MSLGAVDDFVRRTSRGYRARRLAMVGLRLGAGVAIALACVWIAFPSWLGVAGWIAAATLAVVLGLRALALRLDPVEADRRLGLGGWLRTWIDVRGHGGPMVGWLERELAARIAALPPGRERAVGRRRLGPARAALVLLLVLLLLKLLWLPELPAGVLELAGAPAVTGVEAPADPEPEPAAPPRAPDRASEQARPPEPPPDEAPAPEEPEPEPSPPAPEPPPGVDDGGEVGPDGGADPREVELPTRDEFVVPSFVGSGDGRTTVAPAAGLDETVPSPSGAGTAGAGGGADPAAPPDPRAEFERALEAALRSRHVPDDERPFVRRWFRSLVEDRR